MKFPGIMLLTAAALTLAACGDSPSEPAPPPKPNVSGVWQGTLGTGTMRLTLNHDTLSNNLSGSGNITGQGVAIALSANGNFADNTVSLTLSSQGYEPMNFTGKHASATITGTVNGSGFDDAAVTMVKQ